MKKQWAKLVLNYTTNYKPNETTTLPTDITTIIIELFV